MRVSGLSYRQLDYFLRTIKPRDPADLPGSGHQRRFALSDLILLTALAEMTSAGIPQAKAWKILTSTEPVNHSASPVRISIDWASIGQLVTDRLAALVV